MGERKHHALCAALEGGCMSADLSYHDLGLFTAFYPNTKAGEKAWREIARHTEGTGKVLSVDLAETLASLRKAGYSVDEIDS